MSKSFNLIIAFLILCFISCQNEPTPKPTAYFRIDFPEKEYRPINELPFPVEFELPQYSRINLERTKEDSSFFNIDFPRYGARIHISYHAVEDNLDQLLENSRSLVYKHVVKAQDIDEKMVFNQADQVYGTYYQIEGNAASGSQFYLTDSSNHFMRGALYFNVEPNYDSIAPVQEFIKADIERLIESFKWT